VLARQRYGLDGGAAAWTKERHEMDNTIKKMLAWMTLVIVCGIFAMAFAVTLIATPMEALLGTVAGIIAIVLIFAACWAVMTLLE